MGRNVKIVFTDIRVLWKFRHKAEKVKAVIDRREVSMVGVFGEDDIALAEISFGAKVFDIGTGLSKRI